MFLSCDVMLFKSEDRTS